MTQEFNIPLIASRALVLEQTIIKIIDDNSDNIISYM